MLKGKRKYAVLIVAIVAGLWQSSVKALELNKETTDIYKSWNIIFNRNIDFNDEVKNSIKVVDSKGNTLSTNIRSGDSKTIVIDAPEEGYKGGETYTVTIANKIHSESNIYLKDGVKYTFTINKTENGTTDKYKEQVDNVINLGINKILMMELQISGKH